MPRGAPRGNADIRAIRQSLHSIVDRLVSLLENAETRESRRSAPLSARRKRVPAVEGDSHRVRTRLSRARLAALKLQGEYIGRLRGLKPSQKARVKALRARKGFPAAIRLAARLAS